MSDTDRSRFIRPAATIQQEPAPKRDHAPEPTAAPPVEAPSADEAKVLPPRPKALSEDDWEKVLLLEAIEERRATEMLALKLRQETENLQYREKITREYEQRLEALRRSQHSRRQQEAVADQPRTSLSKAWLFIEEKAFPEKHREREALRQRREDERDKRDLKEYHTLMLAVGRRQVELLFEFTATQVEESTKQMANFDQEQARYLREHGIAHKVRKQAEAQRLREDWEKAHDRDGGRTGL